VNRLRTPQLRLFAAALLLIGQVVLGRAALPAAGLPFADLPICHASAPADTGQAPTPQPRDMDCPLCIVCHALGAIAVLAAPAPAEPAPPRSLLSRAAPLPPTRALPGPLFLAAAYPTGPPLAA